MLNHQWIYQFISIYMAFAIVFCSVPLSVNAHFCQGNLKSISFGSQTKGCNETTNSCKKNSCCLNSPQKFTKKLNEKTPSYTQSCCENQSHLYFIQHDYQNTNQLKSLSTPPISASFSLQNTALQKTNHTQSFYLTRKKDQPPRLNKSIPVFIQVFLN